MITLAIRTGSEGMLLILEDRGRGEVEAWPFRDPFLVGMVLDAELRMEQRHSAADP